MASLQTSAVQVAGVEGEVVLGREFAGRTMAVETLKPGVWIVKVGPVFQRHLFALTKEHSLHPDHDSAYE